MKIIPDAEIIVYMPFSYRDGGLVPYHSHTRVTLRIVLDTVVPGCWQARSGAENDYYLQYMCNPL